MLVIGALIAVALGVDEKFSKREDVLTCAPTFEVFLKPTFALSTTAERPTGA